VYYEPSPVSLFYYEQSTETYYPVAEPSPYLTYFYYEPSTQEYEEFTPTPIQWTSYYEEPSVPLYYFEKSTQSYVPEYEPSPVASYYYYEPSTQEYEEFTPISVAWTDFYEPSPVQLYTWTGPSTYTIVGANGEGIWNPPTNYFSYVEEPSPYVSYYYYNEVTESYQPYEPTPVEWTSYYEEPTVELYSWSGPSSYSPEIVGANGAGIWHPSTSYFQIETEPSPYQSYYYYEPSTQSYLPYEPSPVQWTSYYEEPTVELYSYYGPSTYTYTYEESEPILGGGSFDWTPTWVYQTVSEPSPYQTYYYYEPSTESY